MFDSSLGAAVQPASAGTAPADTLDINAVQFGPELDTNHIVPAHNRSIAPQDAIRLASNDRAGRGSAN
jgi:hypothetical protein